MDLFMPAERVLYDRAYYLSDEAERDYAFEVAEEHGIDVGEVLYSDELMKEVRDALDRDIDLYLDDEIANFDSMLRELKRGENPEHPAEISVVAMGSVGRWDGPSRGLVAANSLRDLIDGKGSADALVDCRIDRLVDTNGTFSIEASHHDGTAYLDVRLISGVSFDGKGFRLGGELYAPGKMDLDDFHILLGNLYDAPGVGPCSLPHFAERAYGAAQQSYRFGETVFDIYCETGGTDRPYKVMVSAGETVGKDAGTRFASVEEAKAWCYRYSMRELADGCYPTTADEYLSFYRFIGEYAGTGKMIRQRCEKNDMHVIKSNGYYGFFLVGENGTSIVNGGKTKRVSTHRDIKWAHDNFDTVVSKYLAALAPLRERQEQVSGELKRLGFSGNIHGLIVDVNFSHHIMVNPADGSLVFYYSPEYGWVGTFDSFPKLLEHVKDSEQLHIDMNPLYALQAGDTPTRCDVALERYDAGVLAPSPSMALAPASIEGVEVLEKSEGRDLDRLVNVDLEHGAYKLSRDVAPLQRLFSKHVLRNFDARLAELDDGSAARRTKSMAGRVFKDEFGMMWLIVGDDLGEFVDALDQDGKERRVTVLALRKLVATQGDGRWLTKSLDETESAFKGRYQPKAWRGALPSLRLRDLSAGE